MRQFAAGRLLTAEARLALQAMGGTVSPVLHEHVTLVVAHDITSDKCKTAFKRAADETQVRHRHAGCDEQVAAYAEQLFASLPWF